MTLLIVTQSSYAAYQLRRLANELGCQVQIENEDTSYEDALISFSKAVALRDYATALTVFEELERVIPSKDSTWLNLKVQLEGINPEKGDISSW